jgi:hypothetical protein
MGNCPRFHLGPEIDLLVAAVAKRLVLRVSAAAETDRRASSQIKSIPLRIVDCKLAFHSQRAIRIHRDLCQVFLLCCRFTCLTRYGPASFSLSARGANASSPRTSLTETFSGRGGQVKARWALARLQRSALAACCWKQAEPPFSSRHYIINAPTDNALVARAYPNQAGAMRVHRRGEFLLVFAQVFLLPQISYAAVPSQA